MLRCVLIAVAVLVAAGACVTSGLAQERKPAPKEIAAIRACAERNENNIEQAERRCLFNLVATPAEAAAGREFAAQLLPRRRNPTIRSTRAQGPTDDRAQKKEQAPSAARAVHQAPAKAIDRSRARLRPFALPRAARPRADAADEFFRDSLRPRGCVALSQAGSKLGEVVSEKQSNVEAQGARIPAHRPRRP